ncbi:putative ABC transport system permease protein [Parabacteroides sp. PF5-5]|uniref:ABC transporter permease n=1 Tax=unclassified Parabacteroides TaxID=2649774 RepID=UPI00247511AB|nr:MULTISPECIES: ABC transporter permease [unclassified Parabacteroides]MDH6305274.1 putative ABC transport system permease protein [Parabacteroides sp. PH5-39]MDH6316627.1 putative ABC transport system permease protein [Parabacteroides sp. PF5-13]MDH6320193.1 putative ABC transport system permease protein [Parabacteroides sp. PH5-13]MDH6323864.1 putative ABC transport system permease protein [Parabacteroides sp. PH5-8]MDH6327870.1 putative ABC transport system permease protein [Parabacteroide
MYKQYFKQAIATIRENPLVSFLTILGTALAVAMMMVLVLVYQVKTASFAPVSERHRMLYVSAIEGLNDKNAGFRGGALGYRIINECFYPMTTPESITAVGAHVRQKQTSAPGSKTVRECDVRETDAAFWKVFDFRFLNGVPYTPEMVTSAIPVAVVSERVAREFFGTTQVAGLSIQLDFVDYRIQGVVASVSEAVSEAYGEIWIPYTLNRDIMSGGMVEGIGGQLQLCMLAKSTADFDAIRQEAQNRVATFNTGQKEFLANIWKQPLSSTQQMFYYAPEDRMHGNFSGMLSLAALFLFLPVFNLLAMMFSQMQKRNPEFGLRKAFGATTKDIVGQILAENFIITLLGSIIGLFLSFLFFYITKDSLLQRPDVNLQLSMIFKPALFAAALLTCLVINLLSTTFPAWRTSRAEVVDSLNTNI